MNDFSHITEEFEIVKKYLNFTFKSKPVGNLKVPKSEDFELFKVRRIYHFNKGTEDHIILTIQEPGFLVLINKQYLSEHTLNLCQVGKNVDEKHFNGMKIITPDNFGNTNFTGIHFSSSVNTQEVKTERSSFSLDNQVADASCDNSIKTVDVEVIIDDADNEVIDKDILTNNHEHQCNQNSLAKKTTVNNKRNSNYATAHDSEIEYCPDIKKIRIPNLQSTQIKNGLQKHGTNIKEIANESNFNLKIANTDILVHPCDNKENSTNNISMQAELPYWCSICSGKFLEIFSLQKHVNEKHPYKNKFKKQNYRCALCDYTTLKLSHLRKHLQNHTKSELYKCSQCNYNAATKKKLKIHMNKHKKLLQLYECSECGFITIEENQFNLHVKIHNDMYKCDICLFTTTKFKFFKIHTNFHKTCIIKQEPEEQNETEKEFRKHAKQKAI